MDQLKQIIQAEAQKLYQEMNSNSHEAITKLQENFSEFKEKQQKLIENLRHEVATKDARVKQLELQIDNLEQQQLSNTVRIVNLPEIDEDKDIKQNIAGIATNNLKIKDISKCDIVKAHRMGKQKDNKPRDLILTFADEDKRNSFRNESQRAKLKTEDGTPVYVNDNLTLARSKLFYDCRKWRKTKVLHSTWTQQGNIMVKMSETSKPVAVYNHDDLRGLIRSRITPTIDDADGDSEDIEDHSASEDSDY